MPGLKARPSAKHGRAWIEESPLPCCPECRANQPFRLDCRHDNRRHRPYPLAIITILSPWFLDNGASGIERQYLATIAVGGGNYSNLEFMPTRTLRGRQFTMLTPTTTKKRLIQCSGRPKIDGEILRLHSQILGNSVCEKPCSGDHFLAG